MALLVQLHEGERLGCRRPLLEEATEELEGLDDRDFFGQLRLLQLDTEPLAQLRGVTLPPQAEDLDDTGIRCRQPLADLDCRRLSSTVGTEQAETLSGGHLEVDPVDGLDVLIRLLQVLNAQGDRWRRTGHSFSIASGGGDVKGRAREASQSAQRAPPGTS
jgi:hypothetical protein